MIKTKKEIKINFNDEKVWESFFQILVLIISTISVAYFIHESDKNFQSVNEAFENSFRLNFIGFFIKIFNILPSVSAQDTSSYSSTSSSQTVTTQCCLKDKNGALCQEYSSNVISNICDSSKIFQGKCENTASCKIGTCIDNNEGLCTTKATKGSCELNGGKWNSDPNGDISECRKGCCVLGSGVQYVTDARCGKLSSLYGFQKDFKQVSNELECLALAPEIKSGACVFSDGSCKFTTAQECNSLNGKNFKENLLCSNPELNTTCKKQANIQCVGGKDEIYWFDSCGNQENIYSSDKITSWNNGQILNKSASCNPNSGNGNSVSCGNCNYLLGSKCSEVEKGKGVNAGDFICKDLSCSASKETGGKKRENGESWCVYDSYIGDGKDTVGSRDWKRVCKDGKVTVEPCADYRGEICVQADADIGQGKKLSAASCVVNRGLECVGYNQDKKTLEKNCKGNSQCQLTQVNVDKGFKFSVCTAKYPGGFDSSGDNSRASSSAKQLCSMANQKCTVIYQKQLFGGWKCVANCACETKKFSQEMNNLCIGLGDCGSYVNFVGDGTDNIKVKGAPSVSWQDYKKYANPIAGQMAKPDDLSYTLKKLGLGGKGNSNESFNSNIIKFIGPVTGALGIITLAATKVAALNNLPGRGASQIISELGIKGTLKVLNINAASAYPTLTAIGNGLTGIGVGAVVGGFVAKAFGLSGDAATAVAVAGAVGGAIGATGGFGTGVLGTGTLATSLGSFLAGAIVGLIVAIVVAIIMKLLGVGKIKKVIVQFSCLPWQAPTGGANCEKCNGDPLKPCTKYRCESLGKACELINQDSSNPQCVSKTSNDHSPPVISVGNISSGYKFNNINLDGTKVRQNNDECIPAYSTVGFTLKTDERAQCKFDFERKNSYDDLSEDPLDGNYYTLEHNFGFTAPDINSLANALNVSISKNDRTKLGEMNMYVRCQDIYGNKNTKDFVLNFCLKSGPDVTPPEIISTDPMNDAFLKQNITEIPLTIFVNEPAECKYDIVSNKKYEDMSKIMLCNSDINDPGIFGWECNTTLQGLKNSDNVFYFKCKDQPWFANTVNESQRNVMPQDYIYTLHGTQNTLKIDRVEPTGLIQSGVEPFSVELKVQTSGGINSGVSACYYSFEDYDNMIQFFNTNSPLHSQPGLELLRGDYNILIKCVDDAGNEALGNATFNLNLDRESPIVVRAYRDQNSGDLKLITNEDASCSYDSKSCNFNFINGTKMTTAYSKIHTAPWEQGKTYYVKCQDIFNNEPSSCSIQVSPSALL